MSLRGVWSKNKQEKYEAYNGLCWDAGTTNWHKNPNLKKTWS